MSIPPNITPNPGPPTPPAAAGHQPNIVGIIGFCAAILAGILVTIASGEPLISAESPLRAAIFVAIAGIVCCAVGLVNASGGRNAPGAMPARSADIYQAAVEPQPPPVSQSDAKYGQRGLCGWGLTIAIVMLLIAGIVFQSVEHQLAAIRSCLQQLATC